MGFVFGWLTVALALLAGWGVMPSGRKWPRSWRLASFSVLFVSAATPLIHIWAKWSLLMPVDERLESLAALLAYLLLLAAFWLLDTEGVRYLICRGLGVALVLGILVPPVNVCFLAIVVQAALGGSYQGSGWLDRRTTYQLNGSHALIGGAAYTSYTIYQSPVWFPLVRRTVNKGAITYGWQGGSIAGKTIRNGQWELYELPK